MEVDWAARSREKVDGALDWGCKFQIGSSARGHGGRAIFLTTKLSLKSEREDIKLKTRLYSSYCVGGLLD